MTELSAYSSSSERMKQTSVSAYAGEAICCLLSASSASYAALNLAGQAVDIWMCLLLSITIVCLIFAFTRKWWIFPAFFAGALLLSFTAFQIFNLRAPFLEYTQGFYEWAMMDFPQVQPYAYNGSIVLIYLAVLIPVNIIICIYFKKLFYFPLLPIGSALLTGWLYFYAPDLTMTVLVFLAAANISALAKYNGRKISKKHGENLSEGMLQLPAFALSIIIILFAFALAPKEDGIWRSQVLTNLVDDIGDYFDVHFYGRSGQGSFTFSETGYLAQSSRLGGNISPNNKIVMRVSTTRPTFLTANVEDSYTGSYWYDNGKLGHFRFDSAIWRSVKRDVFALDKPSGSEASRLYESMTDNISTQINPATRSSTLFGGGKIYSVTDSIGRDPSAFFNLQSELYVEKNWSPYNQYIVTATHFNRQLPNFDDNMIRLETLVASNRDSYYSDIKNSCLTLPETLPDSVRELTYEITVGISSPYEKALAIESWLYENCEYTITPGDVPEGRDFVDYFLETRAGYCTYYASAMAIMARCAGLPSRYCTGYAVKQAGEQQGNTYIATNSTGHAWAEVYFYGIGWISFDPTGFNFYEQITLDAPVLPINTPVELTPELPVEEPLPELTDNELNIENNKEPEEPGNGAWIIVLISFGSLIALFALIFTVRLLISYSGTGNYHKRLRRKYKNADDQIEAAYKKLLKQMSFIGLTLEPYDTITSFTARADERLGTNEMSTICKPVLRHRFALDRIKDSEVKQMCDFYVSSEYRIRKEMGIVRYLWRRVLLGR